MSDQTIEKSIDTDLWQEHELHKSYEPKCSECYKKRIVVNGIIKLAHQKKHDIHD